MNDDVNRILADPMQVTKASSLDERRYRQCRRTKNFQDAAGISKESRSRKKT